MIIGGRKVFTNASPFDTRPTDSELTPDTASPVPAATTNEGRQPAARVEPIAIGVAEAARLLDLDRNTLYEMLKRGEGPPARKCGTAYRLDRDAVRDWLRTGDRRQGRR